MSNSITSTTTPAATSVNGNDMMQVDPSLPSLETVASSSLSSEVYSEKSHPEMLVPALPDNFSPIDQLNMAINRMSQDLVQLSIRLFSLTAGSEVDTAARIKYQACNDDLKTLISTRDALAASSVSAAAGSTWAEDSNRHGSSQVVPRNLPLMQWQGS
ncbi:hypothetical protein G6F56_012914 [Rhizopus delemar]|nr:hypothetical protein G6F56_012914 [Rhizopus delemar]